MNESRRFASASLEIRSTDVAVATRDLESSPPQELESFAASPEIAIQVENLSKKYLIGGLKQRYKTLRETMTDAVTAPVRRLRLGKTAARGDQIFWALQDVSFEVRRGDVMGIIGRNGAGKSTLLKILSRITEPTRGEARIHGRVGSLLEVGTGFHPELTGRENVYLNGAILGMPRAEIQSKFDEIVAFAEVAKFIDTPVKHYSSGMYLRLAFAVAAHLEPEILLVDEVLAVGDIAFQRKCLGKMEDVARTGRTVLFVSHNMAAVRSLCNTGILLHEGRIAQAGNIGKCIESYFTSVGAFQVGGAGGDPGEASSSGFGRVLVNRNQANSVLQSEPLEAETTLRINQDISGFTLYCIVEDMQNRIVLCLREESPTFGVASASKGELAIKVTLPPLWLNPGLYSLHFKALFWGAWGNARQVSENAPLDVTGVPSSVEAILHPAVTWSVARGERS